MIAFIGVILTIILLPLYVVRFSLYSIPFTLVEAVLLMTFGLWVIDRVTLLKKRVALRLVFSRLLNPHFILGIIFIGIGLASVLYSPETRGALGIWKAYIVEPVLFSWVVASVVNSRKRLYGIITALVISGAGIAVYAIIQQIIGSNPFAPNELLQGRSTAVYNTGNAIGLFIGPIFAILMTLVFVQIPKLKGIVKKIILLVFTAFLYLSALFFSRSTGALVGIIISSLVGAGMVYVYILHGTYANVVKYLLLSIGIALIVVTILPIIVPKYITPKFSEKPLTRVVEGSLLTRLCVWEGANNIVYSRPFMGAGLNGFKTYYEQAHTCDPELLQYPHTNVLNVWTELGFMGLMLFSGLLYYFITLCRDLLYAKKDDDFSVPERIVVIGAMAGMAYWLTHGLVDVPYFKNDLSIEFWLILIMPLIVKNIQAKGSVKS